MPKAAVRHLITHAALTLAVAAVTQLFKQRQATTDPVGAGAVVADYASAVEGAVDSLAKHFANGGIVPDTSHMLVGERGPETLVRGAPMPNPKAGA